MTEYTIYDKLDNFVFEGTADECSEYMKCSRDSFYCRYSRFTRDITKKPKFRIYKIEETDNLA